MTGDAHASPGRKAVGSIGGLALRLVRQWWPQVAALGAACAVVATTISGALGVGASLQRGLRDLAIDRLGAVEAAVVADEPFTDGLCVRLAEALAADESAAGRPRRLVPALVLTVSIDAAGGGRRASTRATLLACDDPAGLGFAPPVAPPDRDAVLVNRPLAAALAVDPGEAVVLRVPERSNVPSDTPLGRRTPESTGRRLTVAQVLPDAGLARFSLRPVQVTGPLAVTSLATARAILRRGDVANVVFAVGDVDAAEGRDQGGPVSRRGEWLRGALRPDLADYGLALEPAGTAEALRLVSRRLVLPEEVDRVAADVLAPLGASPSLVFLANELAPGASGAEPAGDAVEAGQAATAVAQSGPRPPSVPYSTVVGVATTSLPSGPLVDDLGATLSPPGPDGIIIDRWLADDLAAQGAPVAVGEPLDLRFFLPETLDGRVEETRATLRISGIAAMRGAAVARDLVPEVEGITDEASIADWDPPFPFDRARVRTTAPHDEDDRYWKAHGATPKAFIAIETARRLAASRFGATTAWHVPRGRVDDVDGLARALASSLRPEALGIRVEPLRATALAASAGSTPFGSLFLALSSFLVVAGLLLEWLLFQLLVASRRRDVGVLSAVGWPPARLAKLLVLIGATAAVAGVAVGAACGPSWAAALLGSLGRAWSTEVSRGAVDAFASGPPRPADVWPGAVAALVLCLVAMAWGAWRAGRVPPLKLLRERGDAGTGGGRPGRRAPAVAAAALLGAVASASFGRTAPWQAAVASFFLAGILALVGLLVVVRAWLGGRGPSGPPRGILGLARRGLRWRPARAFSVAAIVAVAEFLIVAVSSFAVRPPADPADRASPTGGWTELATLGEPTSVDPSDAETVATLGLPEADEAVLRDCEIVRLRSSGGDDASCTNLYAAGRPTVLGVGRDFVERGGFRFVAHVRPDDPVTRARVAANPWTLLEAERPEGAPIAAILDQATAQWALKLGGIGTTFSVSDGRGSDVALEIVGLLDASILQGFVIVSDAAYRRTFPDRSGYGMALVDAGNVAPERRAAVVPALTAAWADAGVSVERAIDRLRSLQAVQNTFLAGFQALGTLGLLLGTAGVAAVQMQNILERRGQLALLRAVGFTTGRVRRLLVVETLLTVGLGLAAGTAAGLLAVTPLLGGAATSGPFGWVAATAGLSLLAALAAGLVSTTRHTIPERPRME